jgi:hypothetical protein
MHLYGHTVHSFTNPKASLHDLPDAIKYDAEADSRSWVSLLGLLSETLDQ